MTRALHMRRERQPGEGLDLRVSLCGMLAVDLAGTAVEVTCRLCRARMAAVPVPVVEERIGEELAVLRGAHLLSASDREAIARSHRGEESERPRWRSLPAAFAMWHRVTRDPVSVRSSSDPARFGQRVSGGGGAVRTPGGRDDVLEVERGLSRAVSNVALVGVGREPTVRERQRIMTGRYVERLTYQQIADDLGDGWTRTQVGIVLRALSRAMVEDLAARGVLELGEVRRGGRVERSDAMRIPGYDLEGWKAIADHLGVHETTARTRLAAEGLPIVVARGKVYATKAGLDAWLRAQATPRAG